MNLPAIWRVRAKKRAGHGVVRYEEAIYDETPGYVGCTVRSWLADGYVEWDYTSRRFVKTDADGGWRPA